MSSTRRTQLVPSGRLEQPSSKDGDDGMAQLASPGDEIEFPSPNVAADAPSDDSEDTPASATINGAVRV